LTLFLVLLVCSIVGGVFCLMTCLIGILFAVPFAYLLMGVFYLQATGQRSADAHSAAV
jgi:hypothetical protein